MDIKIENDRVRCHYCRQSHQPLYIIQKKVFCMYHIHKYGFIKERDAKTCISNKKASKIKGWLEF